VGEGEWVRYTDAVDTGSGAIIKKAPSIAACVEHVYANEHGPSGCVGPCG